MTDPIRTPLKAEDYTQLYRQSIADPDNFWSEQAQRFVTWFEPWDKVSAYDFKSGHIAWFTNARLNVSYNCLDRHLETRGDQTAII